MGWFRPDGAMPIRLFRFPRVDTLLKEIAERGSFSGMREVDFKLTGEEFKAMRLEIGLTQEQTAKLFGVSFHTVSSWERKRGAKGSNDPSGPACKLLWYMSQGWRPPDFPELTGKRRAPNIH